MTVHKVDMAEGAAHGSPSQFPLDSLPLTRENILKCLESAPEIHNLGFTRIARVRSDVVVKYGPTVHISEANNLRLVQERTTIKAPNLLDAWSDTAPRKQATQVRLPSFAQGPSTYIVMGYIGGDLLADVWPSMNQSERTRVVQDVASMLKQLHAIKLDKPGPVGEGAKCSGHHFTDYDAGPFKTRQDLEDWFNNREQVCKDFNRIPQDRPRFRVGDTLVMSHMDLHPRNIIITGEGRPYLIDWESAGAYPPYIEPANLLQTVADGGTREFQYELYKAIYDPAHKEVFQRLNDMAFAFTTGAALRRPELIDLKDSGAESG